MKDLPGLSRSRWTELVAVAAVLSVLATAGLMVLSGGTVSPRGDESANDRLVRSLGLNPRSLITVQVSHDGEDDLEIDAGSRDGVAVNDPLLANGHLAGVVNVVGPYVAYADPVGGGIDITADIAGRASATGQLEDFSYTPTLQLTDLFPGTKVFDGQMIETSVDADGPTPALYPPGIPIARIAASNHDTLAGSSITAIALVNPHQLRHVQVLTHLPAHRRSPQLGVLPNGDSAIIATRCEPHGHACELTFSNGAVVSCQRAVLSIAKDWADVPPGTCHHLPDTPQVLSTNHGLTACSAQDTRVIPTRPEAGGTGETIQTFILLSVARRPCTLDGYPVINLDRRGHLTPFRFVYGGQYLTRHTPQILKLDHGSEAYFVIAKYRCDLGVLTAPNRIRVSLPAPTRGPTRSLREDAFDFCKPFKGSPLTDAGNTIDTSPISVTPLDNSGE